MIANYHTHTMRCHHAVGADEEYVLAGLERGLQILGFSDHAPYIFPNDYYSYFRMEMAQLEDYIASVLALRQKYAGQIQIPLGLELEYYPASFGELMQVLKDHPIDYFLLGQHALGNEENDLFSSWPTEDEAVLKRYVYQTMEAMNTGYFAYLAHPDLIRYEGDPNVYRRHMRSLIQEAKDCNLPLEFNYLGLQVGRNYPNRLFWEMVAEENATAIFGCDAHSPDFLQNIDMDMKARKWLEGLDIRFLQTLPL